ncbi:uncharacterized protein ARMOST_21747 [Armillaria ostoyae]|uniref:Uncharacterized protein n=1 Tax=Armillaria ostoyae TaxID=47428 RepID=A0A284SAY2_ARMOS|nr:uncharacterized protein ARMOST_21747 [Armillaria ostoyae]
MAGAALKSEDRMPVIKRRNFEGLVLLRSTSSDPPP